MAGICGPCRTANSKRHEQCTGCNCQHKVDRPWDAKYVTPISDLVIEENPSDA